MVKVKLLVMSMLLCCLFACSSEDDGGIVVPSSFEISEEQLVHDLQMSGTTLNISVKTDLASDEWSVQSNADWCLAKKSNNGKSINVTLMANEDARKRTAIVSVKSSVKNYEITITQQGHGGKVTDIEGDILIKPTGGQSSEAQSGYGIEKTWDGDTSPDSHYHSRWGSATQFPVTLEYYFDGNKSDMDYIVYHSRNGNGNFGEFDLYVATKSKADYTLFGSYDFQKQDGASRITFAETLKNVTKIKFVVKTGRGDDTGYSYVSCSEMQFFKNNVSEEELLLTVFTDLSCSELKEGVTDVAIEALTPYFGKIARSIRDNSYSDFEKEFRVQDYKPYSNTAEWAEKLMTKKYTILDNPTGITVKEGDEILLLVGDTYGNSISVQNVGETGNEGEKQTAASGDSYFLRSGINRIKITKTGMLFVIYQTDLTSSNAKPIKIHIPLECGEVAGYWDLEKHKTNEKYEEFINKCNYKYFCVRGKRMIFYFHRNKMKEAVPKDINSAISLWDDMVGYQHELMGLEGIYPEQMNNHVFAISPETGYMWQADYRVGFVYTYLSNILLKDNVMAAKDNAWGPAHEIGHIHQKTINWPSCSESSNNLFANYTLYKLGKYCSRGWTLDNLANYRFVDGNVWYNMGDATHQNESTEIHMRMHWQLWNYYHRCGHKTDFWPEMFKYLRQEGNRIEESNPGEGQIKFMKAACKIANEDLTEFFEMWGFLEPVNNVTYSQYGTWTYNVTQTMVDEAKAYMAQFSKKAAPFYYLEDRKYGDVGLGVDDYTSRDDDPGNVGYYTQFEGEGQKITKTITYTRSGQKITIKDGEEAVAFELYKDNKLIYFSTKFEFTVPEEIALDDNVKVCAVQANGERFEL